MDWGFVIQMILAILGAALIAGGIVAYRGSARTGVRGFAASAIGAGGVMLAIVIVTFPASQTASGPQEPTVEQVKAIPTSATAPESTEASLVRSMKGYELYSWQEGGDWYFALLVGTNRLKTHDEVTSPDVRVQGAEALKGELSRLPNEEQVLWSARQVRGVTMPPDDIISEISAHSARLGIRLSIDQ